MTEENLQIKGRMNKNNPNQGSWGFFGSSPCPAELRLCPLVLATHRSKLRRHCWVHCWACALADLCKNLFIAKAELFSHKKAARITPSSSLLWKKALGQNFHSHFELLAFGRCLPFHSKNVSESGINNFVGFLIKKFKQNQTKPNEPPNKICIFSVIKNNQFSN